VRVTVVFHGRENQHRNLGEEILMNVKNTLATVGVVEGRSQMMGNRMSIMLTPISAVAAKTPAAVKPPSAPKPPAPGA